MRRLVVAAVTFWLTPLTLANGLSQAGDRATADVESCAALAKLDPATVDGGPAVVKQPNWPTRRGHKLRTNSGTSTRCTWCIDFEEFSGETPTEVLTEVEAAHGALIDALRTGRMPA